MIIERMIQRILELFWQKKELVIKQNMIIYGCYSPVSLPDIRPSYQFDNRADFRELQGKLG